MSWQVTLLDLNGSFIWLNKGEINTSTQTAASNRVIFALPWITRLLCGSTCDTRIKLALGSRLRTVFFQSASPKMWMRKDLKLIIKYVSPLWLLTFWTACSVSGPLRCISHFHPLRPSSDWNTHTATTRGESRWLLTTQLPTCTVPSLSSSFILGASSPLRIAVKSLREKSWRSSVRWPGSVSNRSSTLWIKKKNKSIAIAKIQVSERIHDFWIIRRAKDTRRDLTLSQNGRSWRGFSCGTVAPVKPWQNTKQTQLCSLKHVAKNRRTSFTS